MKKVLCLIAALMALTCVTAVAQTNVPPFVQACLDSCNAGTLIVEQGQSTCDGLIGYGTTTFKDTGIAITWFAYQNSDGYVQLMFDSVVPSLYRQNLQERESGYGDGQHWETRVYPCGYTWLGTSAYSYLCDETVKTNKKVLKKIIDYAKEAKVTLTVTEYFD